MIHIIDKQACCGCAACVQRCPKQCITLVEDNEGFLYPQVDTALCIDCGLCNKVCPVVNQEKNRQPIEAYAAKNPDEEIRRQSSSGGIFTMLAERTIDNGGVVFGAAFNKNWEVEHQYSETKEGLTAFRGSKYVQSKIGEMFKQAEMFLKQGREVLFSGTPCQIAALRLFLRKDYECLITVDFICHGVPSPGVFRTYLSEEKEKFARKRVGKNSVSSRPIPSLSEGDGLQKGTEEVEIESISFRDKVKGWKKFSFALVLSKVSAAGEKNTVSLSYTLREHPFLRGFLADLYLRPSCHSCPAKELKSGSDLTIGDYWGIAATMPELDDDKGISVILVNTKNGKLAFDLIRADKYPASYEDVRLKNSAVCKSTLIPTKRNEFFTLTAETFTRKIEWLLHPPFTLWVRTKLSAAKYYIKHLLKK